MVEYYFEMAVHLFQLGPNNAATLPKTSYDLAICCEIVSKNVLPLRFLIFCPETDFLVF